MSNVRTRAGILSSARVSRVGDRVSQSRTFQELVSARRRNQRPRRARHPIPLVAAFVLAAISVFAAEVIPPKPAGYFNDYASVVSKDAASRFNEQLALFERDTSNQVVVTIFPKMQSDDDVAAYCQRVFEAWGVGQKGRNNGAVLFVFIQDRKVRIHTGYGLEGALPDVTCFDITEYRIKPHFRNNDYEGGLAEGIDSIFKAIRGEYQGTGKTVRESYQLEKGNTFIPNIMFFFFFVMFLFFMSRLRKQRGYRYSSLGGPYIGGWSSGGGGGWSSSDSGGGFSGFSGGGGMSGGGGAGSSW